MAVIIGSCISFASGVIAFYASIDFNNSTSLFSFSLYQDSQCQQHLFGAPTGESNLALGQCASSALAGQTSFSFETSCSACTSSAQSCEAISVLFAVVGLLMLHFQCKYVRTRCKHRLALFKARHVLLWRRVNALLFLEPPCQQCSYLPVHHRIPSCHCHRVQPVRSIAL